MQCNLKNYTLSIDEKKTENKSEKICWGYIKMLYQNHISRKSLYAEYESSYNCTRWPKQ